MRRLVPLRVVRSDDAESTRGNRLRQLVGLIVVAVLGTLGVWTTGIAAEGDMTWGWFAATTGVNEWSVLNGDAKVVIAGRSFTAELYDPRDKAVAITLKGTTRDGKIEAVATVLSTDDKPHALAGSHKKIRWSNSSSTRESILLTEPGKPWGFTIGLTREVK